MEDPQGRLQGLWSEQAADFVPEKCGDFVFKQKDCRQKNMEPLQECGGSGTYKEYVLLCLLCVSRGCKKGLDHEKQAAGPAVGDGQG